VGFPPSLSRGHGDFQMGETPRAQEQEAFVLIASVASYAAELAVAAFERILQGDGMQRPVYQDRRRDGKSVSMHL